MHHVGAAEPPEIQESPLLIHPPSCHAFPPPPRDWETLGVHLQESVPQKDLGSKSSAPALELIAAVGQDVGEGKGEEKHLEVGSWQLGPHWQGEEAALWITDRSVCSLGCKGEFLNAKKNTGRKKVDSARNNTQWRKAASCFPGMGTQHGDVPERVLVFWHPTLHPWAPRCPWECGHGMVSCSSSHFVHFWSYLAASPSSFVTWHQ